MIPRVDLPPELWLALAFLLGLVAGAVALHLWAGRTRAALRRSATEQTRLLDEHRQLSTRLAIAEDKLGALGRLESDLSQAQARIEALHGEVRTESIARAAAEQRARQAEVLPEREAQVARLQQKVAELETRLVEERKAAEEKLVLMREAEKQLTTQFENLASRILEEKTQRFTEQNRLNLKALIDPFKEQLGQFRQRVDEVHLSDSKDRASLREALTQLQLQTQRINQEALNLTRALKGDKRAQGAWGELVLERVLEQSGLRKGIEYEVQGVFQDEGGNRLRPDVIVHLPDGKDVVIDSKVSLLAYERHITAHDEAEQAAALREHVIAVRRHIEQLSARDYANLNGLRSLDFVLMFLPIEAAFVAAFQADEALFAAAFDRHIVVVTPTTLLATLRTIDNIWRYERQSENARTIADNAARLYDKFVGFVEDLEKIGNGIDSLHKTYDAAMNKLSRGRGNLIRQVEGFRALGVEPRKTLPAGLVEPEEEKGAG